MRRVITGVGADGRSCVISDSGPEKRALMDMAGGEDLLAGTHEDLQRPHEPGIGQAVDGLLWTSDGDAPLSLGPHGARESGWSVQWHRTLFGPHTAARLHTTPTFDVDAVLSGEVDLVLENGVVHLGPGDTVVIPGVMHGWRTGDGACDFIVVMWSRLDP